MKGKKKVISLPKTPAWRSVQNMKEPKKLGMYRLRFDSSKTFVGMAG
jgi:hypothetical protein